jgi:DNA repair exonuclease SbcCD ATPase subunit
MQQRNHQALLDLNDSMSASQDLATVQLEKQQLEFELADLQEDYDTLQADQETLTQEKEALEKQVQALEYLRQIEEACRSSYDKAKELVDAFEASGLKDSLPQEPVVEGTTSPAEAYQTIYDMFY